LKPFYWNKLNPKGISVWQDLPPDSLVDLSDLETICIIDDAPKTPSQLFNPKKQNVTTVLDITRANNIGMCSRRPAKCGVNTVLAIMLSRIKKSNSQIRLSLLEINDEQLSIDDLKAIGKHLPTPEEVGSHLPTVYHITTSLRLSESGCSETLANWRKRINIFTR
jgi:hypothetical protein